MNASQSKQSSTEVGVEPFQVSPQASCDVIESTVDVFGKWQLKISILMSLVKLPIAWIQLSVIFLAPPVNFWCQRWEHEGTHSLNPCFHQSLNGSERCLAHLFNTTSFASTIVSEWDLVCDRRKLVDLSQGALMLGVLLGNVIFGVMADNRGRKSVLVLCLVLQATFGFLSSFSPDFWSFVLLRFCLALANGGTMVTSFVMCMEVVGGKWRTIIPILYQIPFGIGYSLLALIAYIFKEWRHFHLAISSLSVPYIALYWLIPESPRWLLATNRHKEALVVLKKAAKENGFKNIEEDALVLTKPLTGEPVVKKLLATRTLRIRTILLCLNWTIAGIVFFAFSQYIGHISKNIYLTVAFGGLTSLPGTIICVFLVKNYGRRSTITYSLALTSLCSFMIILFPKGTYFMDWPRVLLAGAGIIGLSINLPAMYLFTGELFPTVLRNSGVGLIMMFSRVGSMVAPFVVTLQSVSDALPLALMGVAGIGQILLVLPLPETRDVELKDTY